MQLQCNVDEKRGNLSVKGPCTQASTVGFPIPKSFHQVIPRHCLNYNYGHASLSPTYLSNDPDASGSSLRLALAGTADRRQQLGEKAGNNYFGGPSAEDDIPLLRFLAICSDQFMGAGERGGMFS